MQLLCALASEERCLDCSYMRPCRQNYGEHGRELITVEVALRLLQTLADPSAELELAERLRSAGRPDLQATLHNTVFKVPRPEQSDVKLQLHGSFSCLCKHSCGMPSIAM